MSHSISSKQRGPSMEALRDLLAFHDYGGVSLAARKLGEHQPVVTRRLKVFQRNTGEGENLLKRSGKKLELTDTGTAVIPVIRQLVEQYDRMLDYIRANTPTAQAMRIGCGTFSASQYLPEVVVAFQRDFAEIEMLIRIERGRERVLKTADGLFDLAIVTHTPKQIRQTLKEEGHLTSALHIEELCSHRLAVIAHPQSEAGPDLASYSEERPLPVTTLPRWELVGLDRDSGIRQQLETACLPNAELYFSVEGGGWAAAREYARLQMGVAILPEAMLTPEDRKQFVVRLLAKEYALVDRIIYRKEGNTNILQEVVRLLRESVGK